MKTLNYVFGLSSKNILGEDLISHQLYQAFLYKKTLRELHNEKLAQYKKLRAVHFPEYGAAEARQEEIQLQIEAEYQKLREHRQATRTREVLESSLARLKELKAERKIASDNVKALRASTKVGLTEADAFSAIIKQSKTCKDKQGNIKPSKHDAAWNVLSGLNGDEKLLGWILGVQAIEMFIGAHVNRHMQNLLVLSVLRI